MMRDLEVRKLFPCIQHMYLNQGSQFAQLRSMLGPAEPGAGPRLLGHSRHREAGRTPFDHNGGFRPRIAYGIDLGNERNPPQGAGRPEQPSKLPAVPSAEAVLRSLGGVGSP